MLPIRSQSSQLISAAVHHSQLSRSHRIYPAIISIDIRGSSSGTNHRSSSTSRNSPHSSGKPNVNKNPFFRGHDYDPHREPRSECGYFDGDELYGMIPVRQAISQGKRNIKELLVQTDNDFSKKKDKLFATELLKFAIEKGMKIREFSKHDLNLLTSNNAHQGFVLRASPIVPGKISKLDRSTEFECVLVLDEIEDPQNFGALLRTSHYLGLKRVIVRGKNSSPLNPTVSSISFGATDSVNVYNVESLVQFLEESKKNGWQVIGTSLDSETLEMDSLSFDTPTILVLGNEGSGVRPSVLKTCTHLVKVIGAPNTSESCGLSVDSLNVSVTGGILLHHILKGKVRPPSGG